LINLKPSRHIFREIRKNLISWRFVRSRTVSSGQTDERTEREIETDERAGGHDKANSHFWYFCESA